MSEFDKNCFHDAIMSARQHAKSDWPNESVGLILHNGEYVSLSNKHPDPRNHFSCHNERLPFMIRGEIAAMVHSHPYSRTGKPVTGLPTDFGPSAHDMIQQGADGFPWGIIATDGKYASDVVFWGDTLPPVPLDGRMFRHGPSGSDGRGDCYALIRDYYRQVLGIELPEGPRDHDWWHHKENLYLDNFRRAGFRQIRSDEAKPGDVFLAHVNSSVPNHGGVLLDGGLIFHHLSGRQSRKEPILRWRRQITRWIRHEKRD